MWKCGILGLTELLFEQDFRFTRIFVSNSKLGTCSSTYTVYHIISAVCHNRYIKLYKTSFMKWKAPQYKLQWDIDLRFWELRRWSSAAGTTGIRDGDCDLFRLNIFVKFWQFSRKDIIILTKEVTVQIKLEQLQSLFYQKPAYFMSHLSI